MSREKLSFITRAQTLGIFLVVLGHCMPSVMRPVTPKPLIWLFYFIYSFHMPFFMFLAGYLFMYSTENNAIDYPRFIARKAQRLLLPYVCLNLIAFFPKHMLSSFAQRQLTFSLQGFIAGLLYPFHNVIFFLWFLPTLFLIFLVAPVFRKILLKKHILLSVGVGMVLALLAALKPLHAEFLNLEGAVAYAGYFYFGCIARVYADAARRFASPRTLAASLLLLLGLNYVSIGGGIPLPWAGTYAVIAAATGIVFAFSAACFLDSRRARFFNYLDGYYYQIFLLSWFFQISFRILYQLHLLNYPLAFIALLLGGLYFPVFLTKFIVKKTPALKPVIGL
jgi:fucose 4-O-acetylase-like acetyltransferase